MCCNLCTVFGSFTFVADVVVISIGLFIELLTVVNADGLGIIIIEQFR